MSDAVETADVAYVRRSGYRGGQRPGERRHSLELRRWCIQANARTPWLDWMNGWDDPRPVHGPHYGGAL